MPNRDMSEREMSANEHEVGVELAMNVMHIIPSGATIDAVMFGLGIVVGLQAELQGLSEMEADAWLLHQHSNILAALQRGEFKEAAATVRGAKQKGSRP